MLYAIRFSNYFYRLANNSQNKRNLETNSVYESEPIKGGMKNSKIDRPSRTETPCVRDTDCKDGDGMKTTK